MTGASAVRGRRPAPRTRQQGAALFVVLVLLFAMAWFALSAFRISSQQLQIVGNAQADMQAAAAAQRAIDVTISSSDFAANPAAVARAPVATDVDGDGTADLVAKLTPAPKCVRIRPIKTMELDVTKATDRVCLQSSGSAAAWSPCRAPWSVPAIRCAPTPSGTSPPRSPTRRPARP